MSKVIAVSGGFDPLHVGHLRLMRAARMLGDELVVILNSDEWLMRKKGFVFMTYWHRHEIISNLDPVTQVIAAADDDETVCANLKGLRPAVFVNAGDRKPENTPERELCDSLNIKMEFVNVGKVKEVHSSDLIKNACLRLRHAGR